MTGRGRELLLRSDPNPSVTIGISLSTSPATLSASSQDPFYVVITARILSSPQPEQAITLCTHLSPFHGLSTRAFYDIHRTTGGGKFIEIWPRGWPQYRWDPEDLRDAHNFITIPSPNQDTFCIKHQVPRHRITAAGVEKGEKYRVQVTDRCLGTIWWCFGTRDDLEGVRLRTWRSRAEEEAEAAEEMSLDPDLWEQIELERRAKYGDEPTTFGEKPNTLALIREGEVEFEVI